MFSLTRLAKICYLLTFSLAIYLLVSANPSPAQTGFGVSTGWRATPGLPTIAIALPNISGTGVGGGVGGGATGFGGGVGGGGGSVSFSPIPIIYHLNLGQFFPNNGQIIGLPPPTLMLPLNNFGYLPLFGPLGITFIPNFLNPFTSDSTGAPWATITALGLGGGIGIGGAIGGGGAAGAGGGIAGGGGGIAGGGAGGLGGQGGLGGGIAGGGMGGFAGKGMGGFNGRKAM